MWNDTDTPLAYLISFRTYGTWLHGDRRGSTNRFRNGYGDPHLSANTGWNRYNRKRLKTDPFFLGPRERRLVDEAIRETCRIRKWHLQAINVRTNHVHTVVTADSKPGLVLNALKANATRQLRRNQLWSHSFSPWADKGSEIRLWNERSVARAIAYVVNGQGEHLPNFDE
jgi:REP element-mobilizing transposase RayT